VQPIGASFRRLAATPTPCGPIELSMVSSGPLARFGWRRRVVPTDRNLCPALSIVGLPCRPAEGVRHPRAGGRGPHRRCGRARGQSTVSDAPTKWRLAEGPSSSVNPGPGRSSLKGRGRSRVMTGPSSCPRPDSWARRNRRRGQGSGGARPRSGRQGLDAVVVRRTLFGLSRVGVFGCLCFLVRGLVDVARISAGACRWGAGRGGCSVIPSPRGGPSGLAGRHDGVRCVRSVGVNQRDRPRHARWGS